MRGTIIRPGEQIEIRIESVNHSGEGVGRYKGIAVFVPFTIPGEQVIVTVKELKKNFAIGEVAKVVSPSDRRVVPRCSAFTECGGSRFQHIDYETQLEIKRKLVQDSLQRIGHITDVEVHPVIGMVEPWNYRNKAQFQVTDVKGKIKLGFFEEGSHHVVPTTDCLLLDRQITDIANLTEELLQRHGVTAYDWAKGQGLLRHVVIRKGWQTSEIMVVMVTSAEEFPDQLVIAREMKEKMPQITSVVRNINTSNTRQVFGRANQLLAGENTITDRIKGLTFNISPTSFFQVNSRQTEILYSKAVEMAGLTGIETALDVYCGIGTISLVLAQKAGRVFGFEVSTEAIRDAAANARLNGITNVEFISGKAEEQLPKLVPQGVKPAVVIVDPPRQGVEKRALQAIADMAPEKIVYISCDPGTMARDMRILSGQGYKMQEVQPVDMFPQTSHVETVVLITRVDK